MLIVSSSPIVLIDYLIRSTPIGRRPPEQLGHLEYYRDPPRSTVMYKWAQLPFMTAISGTGGMYGRRSFEVAHCRAFEDEKGVLINIETDISDLSS